VPHLLSATLHTTPGTIDLVFDQEVTYSSLAANVLDAHKAGGKRWRNNSIFSSQTGTTLTVPLANQTTDFGGPPTLDYSGSDIFATATGGPLATFTGRSLTVAP
jgi:hypothetical protein